ncbi:uncharacterized protein LOC108022211 isoform X2 [Drosophila biarmipes]|uniref:uncharacterized protein LOC108022211 isoform X2 n=1 Tax=Drosophila biarmipes TaxID=125945 RepID=UPI0021CCC479|nr:uncharacterized protein LOC108022211 isoform X2 [Drosophila biarmipes]
MSINQKILVLLILHLTIPFAETNELREANMKIYCNEFVPLGRQTYIVITMEILPVKSTIIVWLSTPDYLLAYFEVGNVIKEMPPKFEKTSSISNELSFLGIKTEIKPDYEEGYFANLTATFWTASNTALSLLGRLCAPQLTMLACSDPQSPKEVLITRGFLTNAQFLEDCDLKMSDFYNWTLSDAVGLTQFASYSTDNPYINIRPFTLRFSTTYELWRNFYVLQVEGRSNGYYFGARCYVKLIMGPVKSVILGGRTRRAQQSETLWMNGSLSYDFSKRSGDIQFSHYYWNCYSWDDNRNRFCHRNISSVAVFSIPANSLKPNCRYIFRLQVIRDDDPNVSSQAMQVITMTKNKMLQVTIECIRNCQRNYFIPNAKVHLHSRCLNCGRKNFRTQWFIDGQLVVTGRELIINLRTPSNVTRIRSVVSSEDGRHGRMSKVLIKNPGPSGGTCSIFPTEGLEAVTAFFPCCRNFVSLNQPIEYWYYAGSVLLGTCLDCNCEIYLPVTDSVRVLVCDVLYACHTSWIRVKINALRNIPHNVPNLLEPGLLPRYLQTVQSIMQHLHNTDSGVALLRHFTTIHPQSRSSLARLANLTLTLAYRLYPSDQKKDTLLIMLVNKINDNFDEIYLDDDVHFLTEQPFINIRLACLEVFEVMQALCQRTSQYHRAQISDNLEEPLLEKLIATPQALENKRGVFRLSTWQMERLYRHLNYLRDNAYRTELGKKRGEKQSSVTLDIQCFKKFPKKKIRVHTRDHFQWVLVAPGVFEDVMGTNKGRVCLKVVSIKQELNWWYPLEKKPSSLVLSVRIYENEDNFTVPIILNRSRLLYKTINTYNNDSLVKLRSKSRSKKKSSITDEVPKAGIYVNCMREGSLRTIRTVGIYRIVLMEHSVLAIHFTKATHRLQVVTKLKTKPLFREISSSKCIVPARTKSKIILLRNNCHQALRAYLALRVASNITIRNSPNTPVKNGPATFAFAFQIRSCETWSYSSNPDKQHWVHYGCYPTMSLSVRTGVRCKCNILGTYTNYLYYIPSIEVPDCVYTEPHLNVFILSFYIILFSLILIWILMLFVYRNRLPSKTIFIPEFERDDKSAEELHDLVISLRTGGRLNSGTTASLELVLYDELEQERSIRVVQDPEHIFLKPNTTLYLWIRTRDIRIPTRVLVSHNNAGRFPSWFLRRIEVNDIQTHETQVFIARQFVEKKKLLLSSNMIYKQGDVRFFDTWKGRFYMHFEMLWINWSLWQPVTGSWRESTLYPYMTRGKRFCVFISKQMVNLTVCASYFGLTTTETLQLFRSMFLDYKDLVVLSSICFFMDIFLSFLFAAVNWKFC